MGFALGCTGLLISCTVDTPAPESKDPVAIPMDRVHVPTEAVLNGIVQYPHGAVCGGSRLHCKARIRTDENGLVQSFASPSQGYAATDVESAYAISADWGSGMTIAIIDAYGYANARERPRRVPQHVRPARLHLASGCLKIVNQEGTPRRCQARRRPVTTGRSRPRSTSTWRAAACPNCKIIVVQADDDQGRRPARREQRPPRAWTRRSSATAGAGRRTSARCRRTSPTSITPASGCSSRPATTATTTAAGPGLSERPRRTRSASAAPRCRRPQQPRLERDGVERRRQLVQREHHEAVLADQHRVPARA